MSNMMSKSAWWVSVVLLAIAAATVQPGLCVAKELAVAGVAFAEGEGRVAIVIDGLPVAVYCYQDEQITRPYFAHVRSPGGVQVTRHHPPIDGQDLTDHGTIHPGIWLSFGDLNGSDYWRNMARVRQAKFLEGPTGGAGKGTFAVRNQYLDQRDPTQVVCEEDARYTFLARPEGFLILWDSTFSSDKKFAFGDQEEMGLGFRVATPLRVGASGAGALPAGNGSMTNSAGAKNEAAIWGNPADWCDYSGTMGGQAVGLAIFCHPGNFRPSWLHARDYGFLTANPFGRQAFGKGDKSSVEVRPGEKLRLRYGILVYSGPQGDRPDLSAAYQDYLQQTGK
jgi:Methane oxygenase PmoA